MVIRDLATLVGFLKSSLHARARTRSLFGKATIPASQSKRAVGSGTCERRAARETRKEATRRQATASLMAPAPRHRTSDPVSEPTFPAESRRAAAPMPHGTGHEVAR